MSARDIANKLRKSAIYDVDLWTSLCKIDGYCIFFYDFNVISCELLCTVISYCPEIIPVLLNPSLVSASIPWYSMNNINKNIDYDMSVLNHMVSTDPQTIEYIPKEKITLEMSKMALDCNPTLIKHIPKKYLTNDMMVESCMIQPELVEFFPDIVLSQKQIIQMIKINPACFKFLSDAHKNTYDIAKIATDYLPNNLSKISDPKLIHHIVLNSNTPFHIKYIPNNYITSQLVMAAINDDIKNIQYVPHDKITPDIINYVISTDMSLFKYIPCNLVTPSSLAHAINTDAGKIHGFTNYNINQELVDKYLTADITLIKNVPPKYITPTHATNAVSCDICMLEFIPKSIMTPYIADKIFQHNKTERIRWIPDNYYTPDFISTILTYNSANILHIPAYLITTEMISRVFTIDKISCVKRAK